MKCPYLLERALLTCAAVRFTYLPSIREISDFCTVHRHAECPLYCAAIDGTDEPPEFDRWPLKTSGT